MENKSVESNHELNDKHLAGVSGGYHGIYSYVKGDTFRNGINAFVVLEDCPMGEKVRVTLCVYCDDGLWIGSDVDEYLPNSYFETGGFVYIGNNVVKFK